MSILAKVVRSLSDEDLVRVVRAAPDDVVCSVVRAANDAALRPLFGVVPTLDEEGPAPSAEAAHRVVLAAAVEGGAVAPKDDDEEPEDDEEAEGPNAEQEAARRPGRPRQFATVVLDALRQHGGPMTSAAVARAVGEATTVRVKNALQRLRATGEVVSTDEGYALSASATADPEPAAEDARGSRPTSARLLDDVVKTLRRRGPSTNAELVTVMGISGSSLSVALANLALQGRIRRSKRGRTVVNEAR